MFSILTSETNRKQFEATLVFFIFCDLASLTILQYLGPEALSFRPTYDISTCTVDIWFCSFLRTLVSVFVASLTFSSEVYSSLSETLFRFLQISYSFNWLFIAVKFLSIVDSAWDTNLITMFALNIFFSFAVLYIFLCRLETQPGAEVEVYSMHGAQAYRPQEHQGKPRLYALEGLRFFAALHIVLYHICSHSIPGHYGSFIRWGKSQLTLFFCLSGFILAYTYGDKQINTMNFMLKRFLRLYPLLWISIIAVLPVLTFDVDYSTKDLIAVIFSYTAWDHASFANNLNEPAWFVGAVMLCYLFFPTFLNFMKDADVTTRTRYIMPTCFVFSAWQALVLTGQGISVWYYVNIIPFKAHLPGFVFGIALGLNFLQRDPCRKEPLLTRFFGASFCLCILSAIFCCVNFDMEYLKVWSANGLLLPVFGSLIWHLATEHDLVALLMKTPIFVELGKISFCTYMFQSAVKLYVFKYFVGGKHSDVLPYVHFATFFSMLYLISFLVHYGVEKPISQFFSQQLPPMREESIRVPREWFAPYTWMIIQTIGYYLLFFSLSALFCTVCFNKKLGLLEVSHDLSVVIEGCKWVIVLGIPSLMTNIIGQMRWPAPVRKEYDSLENQLEPNDIEADTQWRGRLHIRIVTRGKNPNLVLDNAEHAVKVLRNTPIPEDRWRVEIVTDNPLYISQRSELPIVEILVPTDYVCPNGGKYKARALHYAIAAGNTRDQDWIVHLDEETRFNIRTITAIYKHCAHEHRQVMLGEQDFGKIGQGVILYGTHDKLDNYITTLADSIRVGDDFGKFRLQYEFNRPWIGMHGSFVVANHCVEETFGFDHGLPGSITEDAYFALKAWSGGVQMAWVDAFMYEQSPFTVLDFVRQRARWFGGLYLVCMDSVIPFQYRAILTFTTFSWACSPLICIAMFLSLFFKTHLAFEFRVALALSASLSCWGYILGFFLTFDMKHGFIRYITLLYFTLIGQPLFAVMEIAGILYTLYKPPSKGFFIVQKEQGKPNLSNCEQLAITETDVCTTQKPRKSLEKDTTRRISWQLPEDTQDDLCNDTSAVKLDIIKPSFEDEDFCKPLLES